MRTNRTRALPLAVALLLAACTAGQAKAQLAEPATIRVAILSLFHPQALTVIPAGGGSIRILRESGTTDQRLILLFADGTRRESARFDLPSGTVTLQVHGTHTALTRTFRGALSVSVRAGELRPILTMDTESAVASIVQAEAPPHASGEMLEAQAVAARSFLLANLHQQSAGASAAQSDADTCDTTHCQLLQQLPPPGSPAWQATRATAHLVLTWRPGPGEPAHLVAAQWTPSCAGHTLAGHVLASERTPSQYPFYPVACAWCQAHPVRWTLPAGTPIPSTERAREAWNRNHPDQQIPSLSISGREGQGSGHGLGLCQAGAKALAAQGQDFRAILSHFYPNTTLIRLP